MNRFPSPYQYPYSSDPYALRRHPTTAQLARIGQANPPAATLTPAEEQSSFSQALRQITPTLLIVGIATGAAFALGSGLVSRYIFKGS